MSSTVIRKRKDGGYSECSSPNDLVGKGRCCHISEEGELNMQVYKMQRGMYEVKVNDSVLTINAQQNTIIDFFDNLPKISEEKKNKIIEYLKGE
mgnify:CR=1 FL=1